MAKGASTGEPSGRPSRGFRPGPRFPASPRAAPAASATASGTQRPPGAARLRWTGPGNPPALPRTPSPRARQGQRPPVADHARPPARAPRSRRNQGAPPTRNSLRLVDRPGWRPVPRSSGGTVRGQHEQRHPGLIGPRSLAGWKCAAAVPEVHTSHDGGGGSPWPGPSARNAAERSSIRTCRAQCLARGGRPPRIPPAVLARGGDPPDPPAVLGPGGTTPPGLPRGAGPGGTTPPDPPAVAGPGGAAGAGAGSVERQRPAARCAKPGASTASRHAATWTSSSVKERWRTPWTGS